MGMYVNIGNKNIKSIFDFNSMQDYSSEDAEEMAYTSRQLNSLCTGIQFFNLVVLCSIVQQQQVQKAIEKCFDSTELAYCYKQGAPALEGKCESIGNTIIAAFCVPKN